MLDFLSIIANTEPNQNIEIEREDEYYYLCSNSLHAEVRFYEVADYEFITLLLYHLLPNSL